MNTPLAPELLALLDRMPPVRAMRLTVQGLDGERMRLSAPLDANVNDKGCGFGGSINSLMTLAAWLLVTHRLSQAGTPLPEVYITESNVHFSRKVETDLHASAWLAPHAMDNIAQQLAARGKVRVRVEAQLEDANGQVCASMSASFAAILK